MKRPSLLVEADHAASVRQFLGSTFLLTDGDFPMADDVSLLEAGVVDSTGVLELIMFLEESFGVEVTDAEAVPANLDSVANIVAFVRRKSATT
jgi:acyl carrier protein